MAVINKKLISESAEVVGDVLLGFGVLSVEATEVGLYTDRPPLLGTAAKELARRYTALIMAAEREGVSLPEPNDRDWQKADLVMHLALTAAAMTIAKLEVLIRKSDTPDKTLTEALHDAADEEARRKAAETN